MASGKFNIAYPPRNYIGLDGGLNTKTQSQWLLDNESSDCLNVIFGPGSVETRPGSTKVNTAAVSTHACDGLYTLHSSLGTEKLTAWFGGVLNVLSGTTFSSVPSATSLFTAGIRVCAAEYEDYLFYCNGYVIPYKFNGTDFTRHGVYPPTTTATAGSNASGVSLPTGTYLYRVTYVNSNLVESDLGPETTWISSGSTAGGLTSVPVAPTSFGVAYRYIYRTEMDDTAFYRAGTIADNTSTTFADTTTDAGLGAAAPTDQGVPPKYKCILQHNSRLFMIGDDDLVWYTEIGNPYVVKVTNYLLIGDETAEIPVSLGLWDNYLVVFCKSDKTYMVYMPSADDADWVVYKIRAPYGSKSPFAVFSAMNKTIFPAIQSGKFVGFGALTSAGLDPQASLTEVGAVGSDLMSEMIQPDIDDANDTYIQNMSAIVYKNKAYISFTNTTSTTNDRILVLDFSNQNLSKSQKYTWCPWTGLNISQFAIYGGELYGGSSTANGFVYKLLQSIYSDSGTAIDSYIWTKEYYGIPGHENWWKDWRFVNVLHELSGAWNIGMRTLVDSYLGDGTNKDINVTPETSTWGSFTWGTDDFGVGQSEFDLKRSLGQYRGKRIKFQFNNKNTAGVKFKILGLRLRYNLKGER